MVAPNTPALDLPDPDAIRAEIDAADERARLLRRLLRVVLRIRHPSPATSKSPTSGPKKEATRVG